MKELINVYEDFGVKPDVKRSLGRPSSRWKYNRELEGVRGVKWIQLCQDMVQWRAFINTITNCRFYKRRVASWPTERLSAYHENSMECS